MPAYDAGQIQLFRDRGYTEDEINWLSGLPDDQDAVWNSLAVIEPRARWRETRSGIDWSTLTARGYTADEIKWLQASETQDAFNTSWAQVEANARLRGPVPGSVPSGPGPVNLPPFPDLGGGSNQGAKAFITGTLEMYGLGGLGEWAWKQYLDGMPIEAILLEMRKRPEYKQRFPAMEALSKQGRAISESQYIEYERGVANVFHAAGLPSGFYDKPDDFTRFLSNNVSLPELQDRVTMYAQAAFQVPPEVRAELQRNYGIGPGEITAYFIDEKRALPLIQQQWAAAQIGGQSKITGYGQLGTQQLERLANLGISPEQAAQGFTQLGLSREIFQPLEGGEFNISQQEQLAATFEGNISAQERITRQARRRQTQFEGGGSYAGSPAEGYTGIGSSSS
jgi:hypothetical protein